MSVYILMWIGPETCPPFFIFIKIFLCIYGRIGISGYIPPFY